MHFAWMAKQSMLWLQYCLELASALLCAKSREPSSYPPTTESREPSSYPPTTESREPSSYPPTTESREPSSYPPTTKSREFVAPISDSSRETTPHDNLDDSVSPLPPPMPPLTSYLGTSNNMVKLYCVNYSIQL